jgi:hypothetical protein
MHPRVAASCNRLVSDFLAEAARKAELTRPRGATYGKLQKADRDLLACVFPLCAPVGRRLRLSCANRHHPARIDRRFLARLRVMKQLRPLASGSQPAAKGKTLIVCSRVRTVCKKPTSRARRLLGGVDRVIARLLPDRPDCLMKHHRFPGSKYECHAQY